MQVSPTSNTLHPSSFASSSFGTNLTSSCKWNDDKSSIRTTSINATMNEPVLMTSMSVSGVDRRFHSLERTIPSVGRRVPKRRNSTVIHVSVRGPCKNRVNPNEQASRLERHPHKNLYKIGSKNSSLMSRQQHSSKKDHRDLSNSHDQFITDSFATSSINDAALEDFWRNRTTLTKQDRGQVSPDRQKRRKRARRLPPFTRFCWICCCLSCLLAAILLGTLITTFVFLFATSTAKTTTVTTLSTNQTTINQTTPSTITGTTTLISITISTTETTTATNTTETTTAVSTTQTTTAIITTEMTTTSVSTASVATICSTTPITTTITSTPLPPQCFNYTLDTNGTRNAAYTVLGNSCDTFSPSPSWFRFSGAAGTMLASCPVPASNCNTNMAGWYSGVYPSTAGDTTTGVVCYAWPGIPCYYNNSISVTNCNGYYVFNLTSSFRCSIRYCTI